MPRLLDLFCGAGGAAMGYHRAGFDVVGVDHRPQPNYPFEFVQADALTWLEGWIEDGAWGRGMCPIDAIHASPPGRGGLSIDAIHASPPCQAYSIANNIHGADHPELIEPVRDLLLASGLPYVIENVPGAPLIDPVTVCGLSLGVNVKRHRLFESNVSLMVPPCHSKHDGDWLLVFGHTVLERGKRIGTTPNGGGIIRRKHVGVERGREAMGIDWMNRNELSEAVPPAYTELIGHQLLQHINARSAA